MKMEECEVYGGQNQCCLIQWKTGQFNMYSEKQQDQNKIELFDMYVG